jgi:serine O-acetyltransferase
MPATPPTAPSPTLREILRADLTVYYPAVWLCERGVWALLVYRVARAMRVRYGSHVARLPRPVRVIVTAWGLLGLRVAEIVTGIELPPDVEIGPRLRIWHGGNIVINPGVVIGADCVLRQGVTIGNARIDGPVPRIGNGVNIGAYAQILGDVAIGDGANIGAMAVVLRDVPAGATAVGVPARIIERN